MRSLYRSLVIVAFLFVFSTGGYARPSCAKAYVPSCDKKLCCNDMGGISYCDSSAGRYVCNNGYYSTCYCTRHAVMDLQKLEGCCLWQGGVFDIEPTGLVLCNNGGISEICSLQSSSQSVSTW
jgi:hypothetical protein